MKKILNLTWFGLIFIVVTAYAHPPRDIKITFDPATKMLTAVVMHDVANPVPHHIKEVDVYLNDKKIIQHFIGVQDNHETQTVSYLIPDVKSGDTLAVEAFCSIYGSLKKQITVNQPTP